MQLQRIRSGLDVAPSVLVSVAALTALWVMWPGAVGSKGAEAVGTNSEAKGAEPALPTAPIPIGDAVAIGDRDAPVAVVAFSDFACRYCGEFATKTLPALRDQYVNQGTLLFVLRQLTRPGGTRLATAAACAHRQDRLWPMHDALFAQPADHQIREKAMSIGIHPTEWDQCINSDGVARSLERDREQAKALGVRGTPTFFVGRREGDSVAVSQRIVGERDFATFQSAVDELLKQ